MYKADALQREIWYVHNVSCQTIFWQNHNRKPLFQDHFDCLKCSITLTYSCFLTWIVITRQSKMFFCYILRTSSSIQTYDIILFPLTIITYHLLCFPISFEMSSPISNSCNFWRRRCVIFHILLNSTVTIKHITFILYNILQHNTFYCIGIIDLE